MLLDGQEKEVYFVSLNFLWRIWRSKHALESLCPTKQFIYQKY